MVQNIKDKTKITRIEFNYNPKSAIIFPLEVLFKKLQCNRSMPLAKFNPGKSSENVYRLYCPDVDKYGNKIPFFPIKTLKKYKDKIKKGKSVSLIMLDGKNNSTIFHVNSEGEIYCSFENIRYDVDDIPRLTKYCANILNKILSLFIKYFDPTSLVYNEFTNIMDENIEIIEIEYSANLRQKRFKLDTKYFPGILTKISGSNSLNYKRVSNYDKMNDIDATITKMLKTNIDPTYIIEQCAEMFFNNDKDQMRIYLTGFMNNISVSDHMKEDGEKKIYKKLLHNPGFEIGFADEMNIAFDIKFVNRFQYIDMMLLFLNNLLIIHSDSVKSSEINEFFGKFNTDAGSIGDVIVKDNNYQQNPIPESDDESSSARFDKMFSDIMKDDDSSEDEESKVDEDRSQDDASVVSANEVSKVDEDRSQDDASVVSANEESKVDEDRSQDDASVVSANEESKVDEDRSQDDASVLNDNKVTIPDIKSPDRMIDTGGDKTVVSGVEPIVDAQQNGNNVDVGDADDGGSVQSNTISINNSKNESNGPREAGVISNQDSDEEIEATLDYETDKEGEMDTANKVEYEESDEEPTEIIEQSSEEEGSDEEEDGGANSNNSYGSQFGGGKKIKLKNNSKLSKRMIKYQPLLFKSEGKAGQYAVYSRVCPSRIGVKRQPIIITEEEKNMIDEKYPGSYDKIIKYGTNPKQESFYYVCPKYWNFKEMIPVKEENVDPKHLIPEGAKEVDLDDGKFIYKLSDKYTTPGFIQSKKNKYGYFLPCCFGLKDGAKQAKIIKEAEEQMRTIENANIDDQKDVLDFLKKKKSDKKGSAKIITLNPLDGTKFPLPKLRYGRLPLSIEMFLGMEHQSDKCLAESGNCLYRFGTGNNEKKSFLVALAYLIGYVDKNEQDDPVSYAIKQIKKKGDHRQYFELSSWQYTVYILR